jgi:hypothetical protein
LLPLTQTPPSSTTAAPQTSALQTPATPVHDRSVVEQVITWASISYAAGFFIVLLHTWRLGLPVLDLVQAVYVWIGIPLAVFAYFANQLWQYFRERLERHTAVLRASLKDTPVPESLEAAAVLNVIAAVGPLVLPGFLTLRLFEVIVNHVQTRIAEGADFGKLGKFVKSVGRFLHFGFRSWVGIEAFFTLVVLAFGAAIVSGILIAYVWFVYPRLPQSLGGGAPARVRLVLDVTKISPDFSGIAGLGTSWNKDGPPALTSELQLLYKTADGFWLVSEKGKPFLLDKSVVLSLMYSDSNDRRR